MGDSIDPSLFPVPYGPMPVEERVVQSSTELLDGINAIQEIVTIFGHSSASAAPIGVTLVIGWIYTRLIQGKPLNPFKKKGSKSSLGRRS
jgi:hypothetical protein